MEVAATSQMHLCNTIFKWFLAKIPSGSAVAFRWLKMIFLRGEVQTPSIFSVHHFVPLLTRLRIFLD
jgi:hypothetical protein